MKFNLLLGAMCLLISGGELSFAQQPQRRARQQPSVPEGYREMPFIETAPEPVLRDDERQRGFLLFQRPIMEPVYPNTHPREYERLTRLQAFAAGGEFESLTLSLYPVRDLKNLKVRVSSLQGERGKIDAEQISVRLVTYWNMGFPRYTSRETYRRLPELLESVTEHSSPAKQCQRWWLTVHVPDGAPAGQYRGTVTVSDDVMTKPVEIPLSLRVLPFSLQQDPAKHYSAYYAVRNKVAFKGREKAFVDQATANEYRSMRDHGLDMMPTLRIGYDRGQERLRMRNGEEIERMMAAGLKGPVPVTGGISGLYRKLTPGGEVQSHWRIEKMPPPEFYDAVTEAYRTFDAERKKRGWPEMIFAPIDEVAASHKEFGWRVYKALQDAGMRTYITKNPRSADATAYAPYVDVWCSQPYSVPYEKIIKQQRYEFWSYPNHNAGEIKNRRVMCKGGRMTYGFGFWRSGYTTLIPWHWSWTLPPDPFDYLRGTRSGTGNRIDDRGEVIPAIYWECFREGFDDARYVYTLQQAIWERTGSENPQCREAVKLAQARLQQTWDAIEVQQKYLAGDMWPSDEFNARRWMLAKSIERLHAFPAVRTGDAPSVGVNIATGTARVDENPTPIQRALAQGKVQIEDLGQDFSQWKNSTEEGEIELTDQAGRDGTVGMRWTVQIDHQHDGGEGGDYPIGWPRIRRYFDKDSLDLAAGDILEFMVRVDSDRDEVADDSTLLGVTFGSHVTEGRLLETRRELGDRQRVWIPLRFPIVDLIEEAALGAQPWESVSYTQIFISERDFPDATKITLDVGDVRLLTFTQPVIATAEVAEVIMLPRQSLPISLAMMGTRSIQDERYRVKLSLSDRASGKMVAEQDWPLRSLDEQQVVMDISGLQTGKYQWQISLINSGSGEVSAKKLGLTGELEAIQGPGSTLSAETEYQR